MTTAAGVFLLLAVSISTQAAAFSTRPGNAGIRILDEEATLAQSTFPIAPDDLIRRCREVIAADLGTRDPEQFLSRDFEFVGPTDGPLGRKQYAESTGPILEAIKVAFPDVTTNYYNFHVDPFEPNRVWYTTRAVGTMTGTLELPNGGGTFEANQKTIIQAPQATSMTFGEDGKLTELTAGFVTDRRHGNTRGLSAVYAVFAQQPPGKPALQAVVSHAVIPEFDRPDGEEGRWERRGSNGQRRRANLLVEEGRGGTTALESGE